MIWTSLRVTCTMLVVVGVGLYASDRKPTNKAGIELALSAAPAAIAKDAAVVEVDDNGHMTELRPGHNGWTCLPNDPGTPVGHPVCVDLNGMAWFEAAMSGKTPDSNKVGYSYMLQGGSVWSNVDIAATQLPSGQKHYITIPPHVMILNAKIANESGFPSGEVAPDTGKPFVMYGGTSYAVLIIPVASSNQAK